MNIKEYLVFKKMTVEQFAAEADISFISVYRYLRGFKPTIRMASRIDRATKGLVSVKELLEGGENKDGPEEKRDKNA